MPLTRNMTHNLKNVRGHFNAIHMVGHASAVTTITTQRKSRARAKEAAKRAVLLQQIAELTGAPANPVARCIDGIHRRWGTNFVKNNRGD